MLNFVSLRTKKTSARPNCHTLVLSHLAAEGGKAASMPAAVRPHCIMRARDLGRLALVFGLWRWSANFGRLLVVYYRIAQISRLNLACPLLHENPPKGEATGVSNVFLRIARKSILFEQKT